MATTREKLIDWLADLPDNTEIGIIVDGVNERHDRSRWATFRRIDIDLDVRGRATQRRGCYRSMKQVQG